MSKPSWVPTESDYTNIVTWMREDGATEAEVATRLGLHPSTLSKYKNDPDWPYNGELNEALKKGFESKLSFVENKLWKLVCNEQSKSHFTAVMAWLNRNDYRGGPSSVKQDDDTNKPKVFQGYEIVLMKKPDGNT